jgi:hypothetical protein
MLASDDGRDNGEIEGMVAERGKAGLGGTGAGEDRMHLHVQGSLRNFFACVCTGK